MQQETQYEENPDLNRLCHAEVLYMQLHNKKWSLAGFQRWLNKQWGVRYILRSELDLHLPYVEVLDESKYLLFLLTFPPNGIDG